MRTYKFQLKPNKQQEQQLFTTLNNCRFMYNKLLEYIAETKNTDRTVTQKQVKLIRQQHPFLQESYSKVLQYECYRLFGNLCGLGNSKKRGNKVGKLRFKGERWFKTFSYTQYGYKIINTNKHYNKLQLAKIGVINIRQTKPIKGTIKMVRVKKTVNGWFAHIITDDTKQLQKGSQEIGIDMGIMNFLHASNNSIVNNPLHMNKELSKIQIVHKKISKTKKGSKNRKKRCLQLQRVWEKIDNKKKDFFHKVSTHLVTTSQFIVVEKLNIKKMSSNKKNKYHNHRNMLDSSWGIFLKMLKLKAESAGVEYKEVDPTNTSKTCCKCGQLQDMPLRVRTYKCSCGNVIDRDHNASINILARGKGLTFVGEDWLQSLMNQEATVIHCE
jgi:putative transposase